MEVELWNALMQYIFIWKKKNQYLKIAQQIVLFK